MSWSPVPRYMVITLVTLDCGHIRYVHGAEDFRGPCAVGGTCSQGCPGTRYATGTRIIR